MKFLERYAEQINDDVTAARPRRNMTAFHGSKRLKNALSIDLDQIEADPQHREHLDEESLNNLAASLRDHGQLQPIRVRYDDDRAKYVIIAGERRFRAAQRAQLSAIDCLVIEGKLSSADILREQILENALREDLKPTEQGRAFRDLMQTQDWNGKELAERLHIHPSTVSRTLALLELPEDVRGKVDDGSLTITAALAHREKIGQARRRAKRPTKEHKIKTSLGISVTLKARKYLRPDEMVAAMREAIATLDKESSPDRQAA